MFCCKPKLKKEDLVESLSQRIDNKTVKILDKNDEDQTLETIADAFVDDPMINWITGVDNSNTQREELNLAFLKWLVPAMLGPIFRKGRGVVLGVPDGSQLTGAMAVIPSESQPTTLWEWILYTIREGYIFQKEKEKYGKFASKRVEAMDIITKKRKSIMKPYPKHIYLMQVGVRRDSHGQGVGGKLFRALFSAADSLQVPVYLETESKENESLYHHYGFETIETPVMCAKGDTSEDAKFTMYSMVRRPR